MSHGLILKNGKAEMAYLGEKPWHRLGQEIAPGSTPEEASQAAGLTWEIHSSPAYFRTRLGSLVQSTETKILSRSDDDSQLGVVGMGYKVVQPSEIVSTISDLCNKMDAQIETIGSLFGGKKIWALAKVPDTEQ